MPSVRRYPKGLLERTSEMTLVRKAAIVGDLGHRTALTHHAPRQVQPPQGEISVRTGAKHGAKIPRQLPARMARRALQFFKRESLGQIGLYVIACTGGGLTIGPLYGDGGARRCLQRKRQIVERVLVLKLRQRPPVVSQQSCGRAVQAGVNRNAAFNEWQRHSVQRFLNIGWRYVGRAIAKGLFIAGAAIMLFVGVQDDDLTGIRSSFRATICEALNAAQRYADSISVVAVRSIRHAGKASFYAVKVAGGLDKPVFGRVSQFVLSPLCK